MILYMNKKNFIFAILIFVVLIGLYLTVAKESAPRAGKIKAFDPQNFSVSIDGQNFDLVNGEAKVAALPGSASVNTVRYFGNDVWGDLNNDGYQDLAFLITNDSGGSGVFYYVVVVLGGKGKYTVTNPVLLGDRIAPQSTNIDESNRVLLVNYAQRKQGEPMTTAPSEGVTKRLKISGNNLIEN